MTKEEYFQKYGIGEHYFSERIKAIREEQKNLPRCEWCGGEIKEEYRWCPWCAKPIRRCSTDETNVVRPYKRLIMDSEVWFCPECNSVVGSDVKGKLKQCKCGKEIKWSEE